MLRRRHKVLKEASPELLLSVCGAREPPASLREEIQRRRERRSGGPKKREVGGASGKLVGSTCIAGFTRAEPGQDRPAKRLARGFTCIKFRPG
jgi:hypothetical protein